MHWQLLCFFQRRCTSLSRRKLVQVTSRCVLTLNRPHSRALPGKAKAVSHWERGRELGRGLHAVWPPLRYTTYLPLCIARSSHAVPLSDSVARFFYHVFFLIFSNPIFCFDGFPFLTNLNYYSITSIIFVRVVMLKGNWLGIGYFKM